MMKKPVKDKITNKVLDEVWTNSINKVSKVCDPWINVRISNEAYGPKLEVITKMYTNVYTKYFRSGLS